VKLPQYVEGVLQYLGRMEQEHVGTPAQDAYDRMRKELIEESLTAKNPVAKEVANPPPVKPTKTSGGTFNMCAACAKKWEHGTEPTDDPCLQHRYGFNGCVCENNSHFDSLNLLEKETTAILEKREKEREQLILKIISRMENGEKVHLKKDMASRVLAHVDIKGHKLTGDLEVIQDEPGFVRMFFKGAALRKSGLVKNNPRRSDGMSPSDFDQEQLYNGTQHEKEHTDDVKEAQRIAMDHLAEDANYYVKLEKCVEPKTDMKAIETWDDSKEQSNPSSPNVSELTNVFRPAFNKSYFGKSLSRPTGKARLDAANKERLDKTWRDIELFVRDMVELTLERVIGLQLKRVGGKAGALEFGENLKSEEVKKGAITKSEIKGDVLENRYHKLTLTAYMMSLIQRFFYMSKRDVEDIFETLEEGKHWSQLATLGNREAHVKSIDMAMLALLSNVQSGNVDIWLEGNKTEVQKIFAKSEAKWKKELGDRLKKGEEKNKKLIAMKPKDLSASDRIPAAPDAAPEKPEETEAKSEQPAPETTEKPDLPPASELLGLVGKDPESIKLIEAFLEKNKARSDDKRIQALAMMVERAKKRGTG